MFSLRISLILIGLAIVLALLLSSSSFRSWLVQSFKRKSSSDHRRESDGDMDEFRIDELVHDIKDNDSQSFELNRHSHRDREIDIDDHSEVLTHRRAQKNARIKKKSALFNIFDKRKSVSPAENSPEIGKVHRDPLDKYRQAIERHVEQMRQGKVDVQDRYQQQFSDNEGISLPMSIKENINDDASNTERMDHIPVLSESDAILSMNHSHLKKLSTTNIIDHNEYSDSRNTQTLKNEDAEVLQNDELTAEQYIEEKDDEVNNDEPLIGAGQTNKQSNSDKDGKEPHFVLNDYLPSLIREDIDDLETNVLRQKGQDKILTEYLALLPLALMDSDDDVQRNPLKDLINKNRLKEILDWIKLARTQLTDALTVEFVNMSGLFLDVDILDENLDLYNDKNRVHEIVHSHVLIGLKICGTEKSIDVDTINYFRHLVRQLADILSLKAKFLTSDTQLYKSIELIDEIKSKYEKLIIIQINAKAGCVFHGKDIKNHALGLDYYYGFKKVFHRFFDESAQSDRYPINGFSLINRYSPGYFELDELSELTTKGVCLVMKPVLNSDPFETFEQMLMSAMELKDRLDAHLVISTPKLRHSTEKNAVVNQNQSMSFDDVRDDLSQYVELLKDNDIQYGSPLARCIFGY